MNKFWFIGMLVLAASCSDDSESSSNNAADNNTSNNTTGNNTSSNNANNVASNNANNVASNNANNVSSNNANNVSTNNANNQNNVVCTALDPALGVCDPVCQSGCGAAEHCVARQPSPNQALVASCSVAGDKTSGACQADTECAAGFMCEAVDGKPAECLQYCRPGATSFCANGGQCQPFSVELRLGLCVNSQDECSFFPDSCGDGLNCYDTPNGTRCAAYAPDAEAGVTCQTSNQCNDGFRCVGVTGGALACQPICNPDDPSCPTGDCRRMNDAEGNPLPWGACL